MSSRAIDPTASTSQPPPVALSVTDPPARRRLSGRTGTELASQAIWGAFLVGRSNEAHREVLLAWYGISGPAPDRSELLQQTRHTDSWIRKLTATTARYVREHFHPLTERQIEVLSTPIQSGEDRRARDRWAQLFGIPRPPVTRPKGRRQHAFVDLAVRCIAALGPLTADQITAAIIEARAHKKHRGDRYEDLLDALRSAHTLTFDPGARQYRLTDPAPAMYRDAELVTALRKLPSVFSFRDYRITVQTLGFSKAYRVPMAVHVDTGRGRFTLVDQLGDDLRHRLPSDPAADRPARARGSPDVPADLGC